MKPQKKKKTNATQDTMQSPLNEPDTFISNKRATKHLRDDDTDDTDTPTPAPKPKPKAKKNRTSDNSSQKQHPQQQASEITIWKKSNTHNSNSISSSSGGEGTLVQPELLNVTPATTHITDTSTTATISSASMSNMKPQPPQKKDKHIATTTATTTEIHPTLTISTSTDTKTNRSICKNIHRDTDSFLAHANPFPPTPPTSASSESSPEKTSTTTTTPTAAVDLEDYRGYTDEEWFELMGWHFEEEREGGEEGDLDFVDRQGRLFNYEDHYDRIDYVHAKVQSLVYDRLRNKYGFQQIAVAQNQGTSAPGGGDKHPFPRIFVSPDIHTNTRILLLIPKIGDESPGQWDRNLFTSGERGNVLFASQFSYIDVALAQGWGVVLCDPNGGNVHDSDVYRQEHILFTWDDIVEPSQATCVMYVAFGEGTDAVLSILDSSRADEFRGRVKAVALLDGTNGDKRKEEVDRVWLDKHARSFMAKNGTLPGRNGTKVNAAEEHDLVPGHALKPVFTFLKKQHDAFFKAQAILAREQLLSGRRRPNSVNIGGDRMSNPVAQGSSGDNGGSSSKCGVQLSLPPPSQQSSSVQLSPATENGGFGQVRKDRRKLRLQNEKAGISETATKTKVTPNNSDKNTTALGIAGPGGQQKKGRGRPPKTKGSKAPPKIPRKKGRGRGRPPKIQNVLI